MLRTSQYVLLLARSYSSMLSLQLTRCDILCGFVYRNGLTASAICAFTLDEIEKSFNGPFKHQKATDANWLPVLESDMPSIRPGNVSNWLPFLESDMPSIRPGNVSINWLPEDVQLLIVVLPVAQQIQLVRGLVRTMTCNTDHDVIILHCYQALFRADKTFLANALH
jgi:hypothetical protein